MNVEAYISSGILELYVLGQLTNDEMAEVEDVRSKEPAVKAEIDLIENSLANFGMANAINPAPGLKTEILSSLDPSLSTRKISTGISTFLVAASVTMAILFGSMAFYYWSQWQSTTDQLNLALAEKSVIADDLKLTKRSLDATQNAIDIFNDPTFLKIKLAGVKSSEKFASVFWNETTAETYLNLGNLEKLDEHQQYQLWGIVDGSPVDAGIVEQVNGQMVIKMKNISDVQAFAITIEPTGGSLSPTLDRMVVLGNV